jgi:hypothetical protein
LPDYEITAASMSNAYEDNFFAIAAACARDSTDGLRPVLKSGRFGTTPTSIVDLHLRKADRRGPPVIDQRHESDWSLIFRGYVFQESLLSMRFLLFSRIQVVWQCRSICRTERNQDQLQRNIYKMLKWKQHAQLCDGLLDEQRNACFQDMVVEWHQPLRRYLDLVLTYPQDHLPAKAALVRHMMRLRRPDTYIAGLWVNSMLQDLQWKCTGASKLHLLRLDIPVPSWSWVSVRGQFRFETAQAETLPGVIVLDLSYELSSTVNIGKVIDASICVAGPAATET